MPCHIFVTAKWVVSSLCPVARWHYLPPVSFQKVLFSLSLPLLFHHASFLIFLSVVHWPFRTLILACLIGQPFCISFVICICLHPDALSLVVLISVLLYQSAGFVFLDGSWVSEGLQGMTIRTAGLPAAGNLLGRAGEDLSGLPDRASCYQFFKFILLMVSYFNSSTRFRVAVAVFVLRIHSRNISFLLYHQTDRFQCCSM